jgi:hypothetical protein
MPLAVIPMLRPPFTESVPCPARTTPSLEQFGVAGVQRPTSAGISSRVLKLTRFAKSHRAYLSRYSHGTKGHRDYRQGL